MEQGKPLLTIGFAFTALGMLVFMLGPVSYTHLTLPKKRIV